MIISLAVLFLLNIVLAIQCFLQFQMNSRVIFFFISLKMDSLSLNNLHDSQLIILFSNLRHVNLLSSIKTT